MSVTEPSIRNAKMEEVDALAQLWLDGWRDAHLSLLPVELARARTLESFRQRLRAALEDVRVVVDCGKPLGFALVKGDELYQFYVAAEGRGTGLAALLMQDCLARFVRDGFGTAWLACAIGNMRAAKFYEKAGWRRVAVTTSLLETGEGTVALDVWRYEIDPSTVT